MGVLLNKIKNCGLFRKNNYTSCSVALDGDYFIYDYNDSYENVHIRELIYNVDVSKLNLYGLNHLSDFLFYYDVIICAKLNNSNSEEERKHYESIRSLEQDKYYEVEEEIKRRSKNSNKKLIYRNN